MKRICLDAGHGKNTAGKSTPDGIKEWTLNNAVCNIIKEILLNNYKNVEIIRIDDISGDTDVSLDERVRRINNYNPSVMVSIHHNAFMGNWGNHTGTEVYYHTYGSEEDKRLANIIAPKLAAKTNMKNRGVKDNLLYVLSCKTSVPAVLCEGGFMDSNLDSFYIRTEEGKKAYAEAVVESLEEFLSLEKKESIIESPKEEIKFKIRKEWAGGTYNKEQFGAYTNLEKAKTEFDNNDLKSKGYFVFDMSGYVVYTGKESEENNCSCNLTEEKIKELVEKEVDEEISKLKITK